MYLNHILNQVVGRQAGRLRTARVYCQGVHGRADLLSGVFGEHAVSFSEALSDHYAKYIAMSVLHEYYTAGKRIFLVCFCFSPRQRLSPRN